LVDVLQWRERDFATFVARRKASLRRLGPERFFQAYPFKYICPELVPKSLKKKFAGKRAISVEYGLMDAIAGEFPLSEASMMKYGLQGAMVGGKYHTVCEPNFDLQESRLRYRRRIEELKRAYVPTPKQEQQEFAEYEKFWKRVLVEVLEWSVREFKRFVARQRADFLEFGGDMFFHDPAHKSVWPELLPENLKQKIVGLDAILAEKRLMAAIAGSPSPHLSLCDKGFDVRTARRRYCTLLRRLEKKTQRHSR